VHNRTALIVDWDVVTANVYDGTAFQEIVETHQPYMAIFPDTGFRKADWQPENLKICQKDEWNSRMIVEIVLSVYSVS
jgi:hypothetical protein